MITLLATNLVWGAAPSEGCELLQEPQTTERQDINVADMTGLMNKGKGCITVVELWASWCGPCVQIAPEVDAYHKAHPEIAFLSISADAVAGTAEKFWRTYPPIGPKYRLNSWTMDELKSIYGTVGATFPEAIPYFIVLDAEGKLQLEMHEPKNLNVLTEKISALTPPFGSTP